MVCVEVGSFYANFWKSFYHKWVLNFVKSFFCIDWDDHMVFILNLLMCYITLIDLWILKNPCIPGINPTWSWYIIFLMCCWILFTSIFLSICICVSQWYRSVIFFFMIPGFYHSDGGLKSEYTSLTIKKKPAFPFC